jgi:hypothetical protein
MKTLKKYFANTRQLQTGATQNGVLYAVTALAVLGFFAAVMTGGITPTIIKQGNLPSPGAQYTCCDSGDGPDCHPILEKQITYNGDTYALLKSNIVVNELGHYAPTNVYTPDGNRIFIGTSDRTANYGNIPGCENGKDLIRIWPPGSDFKSRAGKTCFGIPNDELIYICKDTKEVCNTNIKKNTSPFDVYYRLKDGPVPKELSTYCPKPYADTQATPQQVMDVPTPGGRKNLQLETFKIIQQQQAYEWDNQWCKPAIYLYPTEKTNINVKVDTIGKLNLTIPTYPQNGWDVTAYPNGSIVYKNATYPYLYYEAALPDTALNLPSDGYVIAYNELDNFFNDTLPQLGLNGRETIEFSDYWEKALPKSPYYFIGIMPQDNLQTLAKLNITPQPNTVIRVSLYFKPLDKKMQVNPPQISKLNRDGFTVVEWGGLFKADKNHPNFTCMM